MLVQYCYPLPDPGMRARVEKVLEEGEEVVVKVVVYRNLCSNLVSSPYMLQWLASTLW